MSSGSAEMPKYKCYKEVHALKIAGISPDGELLFENKLFAPMKMDADWLQKHKPAIGGYYVVYKDGYKSYSPAKAFESGYSLITNDPQATKGNGSVAKNPV